jgi:hypothetical protein
MDCHEIQQKLEAFHDGELPPDQAKMVSDHLESCPVCQTEFERLCKLDNLVAETEGLDPGPEAWQRMRAKIQQGISPKRVVEQPQIWEWIKWLLSPQYVVVKVGAVLAVVVLTFVVSHRLTIKQITPPNKTIPELAIPSTVGQGTKQEIPAPKSSMATESLPPTPKLSQPIKAVEKKQETAQSIRKEMGVIEEEVAKSGKGTEESPQPLPQLQAEQVSPITEENAAGLGDTLRTLSKVHADSEAEFRFRGGRSDEALPIVEGLSAHKDEKIAATESPSVLTGGYSQESVRSKQQPKQVTESYAPLSRHLSSETPFIDSLLICPFSPISYWETYRVSPDSLLREQGRDETRPSNIPELEYLRMEYHRCENQPCQELVIPYLVDVQFRTTLESQTKDNITETMKLMKQYKGLLKESWGKQRYNVRWEKIHELSE